MQKKRTKQGTHWTIDHVPNRTKKPFRLRWKRLKSLGKPKAEEFGKDHYFTTQKEAYDFASTKVDELQRIGDAARDLSTVDKANIVREAARLIGLGIDPIAAMQEGATLIESHGEQGETEIGEFWSRYFEKNKTKAWGSRHTRAQERFFEETKETFMRHRIKTFTTVTSGRRVIELALESYRSKATRNAENTLKGALSKMRSYLSYLALEVDSLEKSKISDMFAQVGHLLPDGCREEAKNVAISADGAKYLIQYMAERKLAGWIVFKLFAGARTLLLQQWLWSVVDWESETVRIPKSQTKLKKSDIRFTFSEIPNFKEWLLWAWKIDGSPTPEKPICRFSQPTITKHVAKALNEKKGLFVDDERKKITPRDTHRNFLRSAFITYGLEKMSVGVVTRIAEDKFNLDKYTASDATKGKEPEATKFWSLKPHQISLNILSN